MSEVVTRGEFIHLEGRVSVLESEVSGERSLTRHIFEQTRANSKDLTDLIGRMGKVEGRLEKVESEVKGLRKDMPAIVADAMREVLREGKA